MGGWAVLVFAFASISVATAGLTPFATITGLFPGMDLPLILTIGMGFCLVIAYTYAACASAVRRNAADYVLTSRVLPPWLAFAFSLAMVFLNSIVIGVVLARAGQVTIPVMMRSVAIISDAPAMLLSVDFIASPEGNSLVGAIAVGLAFLLAIMPPRANLRVMQAGMIMLVISWAVVILALCFPSGPFPLSWDRFMGEGNFAAQLDAARGAGMAVNAAPQGLIVAGLLAAMWIFYGFQTPAYVAGEVKTPGRSLLIGSIGSIIISWLLIAGSAFFLQHIVSPAWISAQSFLALQGGATQPWINFYAAIARPNLFLILLVSFTWLFSMLNMAQAYFLFTSRIIAAWMEDGLVPGLSGSTRAAPSLFAVLIVGIIAQFGVWIVTSGGTSTAADLYFIFFTVGTQIPFMLAAVLAPFTRREWFKSAGRLANLRIGPLPLVSLTALLSLAIFAAILVIGLRSPLLMQAELSALLLLGLLLIPGLVVYFFRRKSFSGQANPFRAFPPPVE
jgi:amino acid transporter